MKRILTITLTLAMLLAFTVPTLASGETDIPPVITEDATDPIPDTGEDPNPSEEPEPDADEDPEPPPNEEPEPAPEEDPEPDPDEGYGPDEETGPDSLQEPGEDKEPDEDSDSEDPEESDHDEQPVINVVVPATGQMILNPYGLRTDLDGLETTDQIVHQAQTLVNLSDIPVSVDVRAVGVVPPGSGAAFVTEPSVQDAWDRDVFVYAEFQDNPDFWTGCWIGASNQVVATEYGGEGADVLTLNPFSEGYFRLFGAMAVSPEPLWTDEDTFNVILTFTFSALPMGEEPVDLDAAPETPEEVDASEAPDAPETLEASDEPEGPEEPVLPAAMEWGDNDPAANDTAYGQEDHFEQP